MKHEFEITRDELEQFQKQVAYDSLGYEEHIYHFGQEHIQGIIRRYKVDYFPSIDRYVIEIEIERLME